jgi:nitroimidazol reductase NimA-like FMN-containing flavoprotein (pyridoxamine 5'-phosphate oxidase superfamily)
MHGGAATPTVCDEGRALDNDTKLVELGRERCLRLLAGSVFGRVAVNSAGWPPLIRPVFYVFDEPSQSVIFRSAAGSKLTSLLRSERVAFEVDGVDLDERLGWSVIVVGPVEALTGGAELERLRRSQLRTWVADEPAHYMRIHATVVSGRRLTRA